MHPFLSRLGIPIVIQQHFSPFYTTDDSGNLCFSYHDHQEVFGFGFHRVPATEGLWMAGELSDPAIQSVFISHSAMEIILFAARYRYLLGPLHQHLFLATGAGLYASQLSRIRESCEGKCYALIFEDDLLGRVADVKAAAALHNLPVSLELTDQECLYIRFRNQHFCLPQQGFSLHVFERASGYRFGIKTYKSKTGSSFLDNWSVY